MRNPTSGISTVVRTGGETRGVIDLTWDGKDQAGRPTRP
ncbi:flagellar hook assembly protein FlgD [Streptomyces cinnamonensis]|nr:flagellar hook assembly protein FlgD [Streptomyces virginiae]